MRDTTLPINWDYTLQFPTHVSVEIKKGLQYSGPIILFGVPTLERAGGLYATHKLYRCSLILAKG